MQLFTDFDPYQNIHRWFGLRVDMISCLYVTILTFLLVRLAELGCKFLQDSEFQCVFALECVNEVQI